MQFRLAGGGLRSLFWVMFTAEPDCPSGHSKVTTSDSESRAMSLFLKVQPWSNPELPVSKQIAPPCIGAKVQVRPPDMQRTMTSTAKI